MAFTVITFLFMLEASAFEVPRWVQQKSPSFNSAPVLQKFMAPFRSLQSKMQTPNSRRLQAIMSEECATACPGVKTFLEAMMTPPDDSLSDEEKEAAGAKLMCDNVDTLMCTGSEKVCQDEGQEETTEEEKKMGEDLFKCSCACTAEMKMIEDSKKMCANKDKVVGCLTSNSACGTTVSMLGGTRSADIICEMLDLGCEELGEKLPECVGAEKMTTFGGTCSPAAMEKKLADEKDKCCPILSDVMGCYKKDCVTLGWEQQELMLASEPLMKTMDEEEKEEMKKSVEGNYQWGEVCTDSSLPASKAALMSASGSASADDAYHAVPVLGMAVMLIAASF